MRAQYKPLLPSGSVEPVEITPEAIDSALP